MTQHFFTSLAAAQDAIHATEKAVASMAQEYQDLTASLKAIEHEREMAFLRQAAAKAYIRDNQRYHVGDVFRNTTGNICILTLVTEVVDGKQAVFGYLISLGDCGNAAGRRWSDSKGSFVSLGSTTVFSEGLTRGQFEQIAGKSACEFELIGTTNTTSAGQSAGRNLKLISLGITSQ